MALGPDPFDLSSRTRSPVDAIEAAFSWRAIAYVSYKIKCFSTTLERTSKTPALRAFRVSIAQGILYGPSRAHAYIAEISVQGGNTRRPLLGSYWPQPWPLQEHRDVMEIVKREAG